MIRPEFGQLRERQSCPCCGSGKFQTLLKESYDSQGLLDFFRRHYNGLADISSLSATFYHLVRCIDCQLAFQRTIPGDALVNEIYEEWIPASERERLHRERSIDDYRYWSEQIHFFVQHLGKNPYDIRVLDFGMGWAEWASMARAYGCTVAGAELSQNRIDHARSIGIHVVSWDEIPTQPFHFINTEQVFEHLTEPLAVLQHLASALAENGVIRLSVPDSRVALKKAASASGFGELAAETIMPIQPLEHINCFESHSLTALAAKAGLKPVRPSLHHLYNSSSGWLNFRNAARLALRPIYRHVFPGSTILYFSR
jgi:2-polyprenyl-3-methyl-5-hydroxy-6-metoxy-1,4-benzoquinol methylase